MIKKLNFEYVPDKTRVILRPFEHGSTEKRNSIIDRIKSLTQHEISKLITDVEYKFSFRHRSYANQLEFNLKKIFPDLNLSAGERKLAQMYFSNEYALESAALMNPSIVFIDNNRFVISLRAVGEGHISALEFREGLIDNKEVIQSQNPPRFAVQPKVQYKRDECLLFFDENVPLNERVIYPVTSDESNGIEDVRLVKFIDNKGDIRYLGTYTAYDGSNIGTKILETGDFLEFKTRRLRGQCITNKGFALFPRKINNQYVMCSRIDGQNLYIMYSDNLYEWNTAELFMRPKEPWEFVQLGNCGSPVEIDQGWLMLTHGVGPVRTYSIGAVLLDKDDPTRITGRMKEPLIVADEKERDGYVPNVVYTCGCALYKENFIIPYAKSDYATGIAIIKVADILSNLY